MRTKQRNERILFIASAFLLLSLLFMFIALSGILLKIAPDGPPASAAVGIALAIGLRVIIFILYLKFIRESRVSSKNRRGEYIGIGIFHLLLGLVYMDGAFAFLGDEGMLHVSILMFGSTASDLVASSMMIILFFLKPQESNPTPTQKKEELL
jgi:hypothetical protein